MFSPVWSGLHDLSALPLSTTCYAGGYVYARYPEHPYATAKGFVPVHRLVVENRVGRYLRPQEEVHHRDLDKTNNNDENLELCADSSDHMKKHHLQGALNFDRNIEWPPLDEMLQLLDSMSVGSVARKLGVYRSSVVRWCKQHGYKPKPGRHWQMKRTEELRPPKEELERLVWEMPLGRLAERYDVSLTTASSWCKQLKVELPPRGHWTKKKVPRRRDLQAQLERSTLTATAVYYNVTPEMVVRWIQRLGISWESVPGARKSVKEVDNHAFRTLYKKVLAGELAVWQAEAILDLPGDGFNKECQRRGLPTTKMRGRVGCGRTIQFDVQELQEVATRVQTGELSIRAAATQLGVVSSTFRRHCAKHGVGLPRGGNPTSRSKQTPSREELLHQLQSGGKSGKLAHKYGVSRPTFNRWIEKHKLTKYTNAARYSNKEARRPSKEELKRLLWEAPRMNVAERFDVDPATLRGWVRQLGLAGELPPRGYWIRKTR